MRRIDHIAYAVPNLKEGCQYLEKLLGCEILGGGRHLNNGTHNALINLGNEIYLEILAVDTKNEDIKGPRWMGVDLISSPRVTRWALKSSNLASDLAALKKYNTDLGNSFKGSRKKQDGTILKWNMALPLPAPAVEIAPFAVDWKDSIHPTKSLPNECQLLSLELRHPTPSIYHNLFRELDIALSINQSVRTELLLKISTPNGIVELS